MKFPTDTQQGEKKLPIGSFVICALIAGFAITYFGVAHYYKAQIQGSWECRTGDGRFVSVMEFQDYDTYLDTESKDHQFYGTYSVEWKTITTKIIGSTTDKVNVDENNPLATEIDFIEKSKNTLILKAWPQTKPMGISLFCTTWSNGQ